ncbi:hypothetical protein LUZ60_017689 [Juncus effusus]|nr:hypothetical protein LUZ60_017689 [Juncus effusus]
MKYIVTSRPTAHLKSSPKSSPLFSFFFFFFSSEALQSGNQSAQSISRSSFAQIPEEISQITLSDMARKKTTKKTLEREKETPVDRVAELFEGPLGMDFKEDDDYSFAHAKIRAAFYPKFENDYSDQKTRARMVELVSQGLATLEVSLKHSGSLFMYAGREGGAYAKNSFGNIYTATGVFVLSRMLRDAWGKEAQKIQNEFNDFLEKNRICVSMELVTAVLGDHGQRPKDDYAVVTAVSELGNGKPKFYSTPQIIAFCNKWRLPTNSVWLFSTRESVTELFEAYDALCEEGTATTVCRALDKVADISVPGSKIHIEVQGDILEGLVARIVNRESSLQMENVRRDFPPPPFGVDEDLGPSLREICAENQSDEKQKIKALLEASMCSNDSDWFLERENTDQSDLILTRFLNAHPVDYSTMKLQELIRLMGQKEFVAKSKCCIYFHKINTLTNGNLYYKMVIHVRSDKVFGSYQQEMRSNQGLWPLYRGFFVDVNLFKAEKDKAAELRKEMNSMLKNTNEADIIIDGLSNEDANLMLKLKFLNYKIRTFLIRNGLSKLFKDGLSAYRTYYNRQMKSWGTSQKKQRDLGKMLDEWAEYITSKYQTMPLESTYLTEAEPFLQNYANIIPQNQPSNSPDSDSIMKKDQGLLVFFPGLPGCGKSALCTEIMKSPDGLGDGCPVKRLEGDNIEVTGKYWPMVSDQLEKEPNAITFADKNAPNVAVWEKIEDMSRRAVPVVPTLKV